MTGMEDETLALFLILRAHDTSEIYTRSFDTGIDEDTV